MDARADGAGHAGVHEDEEIRHRAAASCIRRRLARNAYLATLPKSERDTLEQLRTLIKETVPKVEERISYGTAVLFSLGSDLGGNEGRDHEDAPGQRRHDSFFDRPSAAERLVEKILRARVRENAALREVRSHRRPGGR